jgi:hypothetical protein
MSPQVGQLQRVIARLGGRTGGWHNLSLSGLLGDSALNQLIVGDELDST